MRSRVCGGVEMAAGGEGGAGARAGDRCGPGTALVPAASARTGTWLRSLAPVASLFQGAELLRGRASLSRGAELLRGHASLFRGAELLRGHAPAIEHGYMKVPETVALTLVLGRDPMRGRKALC
uniref:Uncharacterized protein n=1 Tax=Molossus molossus TaxID=27622 RepID=A0A7J8GKN0_MOLMO|nr:hypothetical protein HJG59_011405 [Molossus molossus]